MRAGWGFYLNDNNEIGLQRDYPYDVVCSLDRALDNVWVYQIHQAGHLLLRDRASSLEETIEAMRLSMMQSEIYTKKN